MVFVDLTSKTKVLPLNKKVLHVLSDLSYGVLYVKMRDNKEKYEIL